MHTPTPQEIIDYLSDEVKRLKTEISKESVRNVSIGFNSDGGAYWEGESWRDGKKVGLTGSYYAPVFFQTPFAAPSSTTNDREIARTIKLNSRYGFDECGCSGDDMCGRHQAIAAALAATRREALAEQMERDCRAVCGWCADGYTLFDGHIHMDKSLDFVGECSSAPIRAAAIEAMREE